MLMDFLNKLFEPATLEQHNNHQLAAAALLVEVAMADGEFSPRELNSLKHAIAKRFNLSQEEVSQLIEKAREMHADAVSQFEFTRAINAEYSQQQKFELVRNMWEIAYADGNLDKYEEYTIRKLAELLYLPHSEFIRAKMMERN